jgi:hypothetical protein
VVAYITVGDWRILYDIEAHSFAILCKQPTLDYFKTIHNHVRRCKMAECDTCSKEILRSQGHLVSGPEAASIMRAHYEELAKGLGMGSDYVEACLAMARQGGSNLVCDECYAKIKQAR